MVEILLLTKQRKPEVWKTANHLEEGKRQKRKLNAIGCFVIGVERSIMFVWVCRWAHPRRRSRILTQEAKFAPLQNSDFAWNQRHRWVHKNWNFKFDVECQFILRRVIFTDEATFRMNGYVKRRKCHICIEKCPREIYEYVRNFQKVNLCCSIMQDHVVGPFVFAKNLYQCKHMQGYFTNIYLFVNGCYWIRLRWNVIARRRQLTTSIMNDNIRQIS